MQAKLLFEHDLLHLTENRTESIHHRPNDVRVLHIDSGSFECVHRVDAATELEGLEIVLNGCFVPGAEATGDRFACGKARRVLPHVIRTVEMRDPRPAALELVVESDRVAVVLEPQIAPCLAERLLGQGLALLGRVCLEQGKAGDAVTWYEQAATRQPESTDIRRSLAQAYRLSGQMESANALEPLLKEGERALAEVRKLNGQLNQNPGDADIRYRLGELTWRWQNRREGLNWMKVVLRVDPEHLEAQRFLAEHATEGEAADGEPRVGLLGRLPENP